MKKSRIIKINGEEYKYFVDTGAINEDGEKYTKVWLYHSDGNKSWWNDAPKLVTNGVIKRAILEHKFHTYP